MMPPPHRPLDPPPPMYDATYTIVQDNEKAKAQYPRSPPDLPRAQNFQNVLDMTKYPSQITDRILTLLS